MVDVTVEEQRNVIKIYVKLGKSLKETTDDLQSVYKDFALTYPCFRKWFLRFADGRVSVEDDTRKGRPVTVKTSKLIADAERLETEDRRITVRDI